MAPVFPFTAIVGQEEMKTALILAAIDPRIGGVMIFGDRGAGKSTAVRALAAVLPPLQARPGCLLNCGPADPPCALGCAPRAFELRPTPVVDLPLGATEDRLVGALDIEAALTRGEKRFEPGLIGRAHRGFLYIDEVNLLEDHLIDVLLDVAASGENLVEREGLSLRHAARFVLVGSGNPEEGDLRPQLLDRFGLCVEVATSQSLAERVEIVRRRDRFDRDPGGFLAAFQPMEADLRARIVAAREAVKTLELSADALEACARLCLAVGADGLRGELTLMRAARALAALEGAADVAISHIGRVAAMSLRHRLRRNPLEEQGSSARIARAVAETFAQ